MENPETILNDCNLFVNSLPKILKDDDRKSLPEKPYCIVYYVQGEWIFNAPYNKKNWEEKQAIVDLYPWEFVFPFSKKELEQKIGSRKVIDLIDAPSFPFVYD